MRNEAFGRPGPWATEAAEIEAVYGPERTVHVSLEEFARTLTSGEETAERFREGGVPSRTRRARLAQARRDGEVEAYRRAYRKFRAFDRSNVLPLFAAFRFDRAFAREFPEAVQVGPLWPGGRSAGRRRSRRARPWVWYASPASAEAIAPAVVAGLSRAVSAPRLLVRTPRSWSAVGAVPWVELRTGPMVAGTWRRTFRDAGVRIVTGSRSLLEALEDGGPFLYFNGVLGSGSSRRRHRPEKIVAFLELARAAGWSRELLVDLDDFSRGRRVADVVARAARGVDGWAHFPSAPPPAGFAPGFEDAGRVIVRTARSLAEPGASAGGIVAQLRRASNA